MNGILNAGSCTLRYNSFVMKQRLRKPNSRYGWNVAVMIVVLLLFDIVVLAVGLHRTRGVAEPVEPEPSNEPIVITEPEPIVPEEPVVIEIPEVNPILSLNYHREPYEAEDPSEGFVSEWYVTYEAPAYAEAQNTYETIQASILTPGSSANAVQISRWGIPLESGKTYTVFFNLSSSVNGTVGLKAYNGDTGVEYSSSQFPATQEPSYYEYSFSVPAGKGGYNGVLAFQAGTLGVAEGSTVTIHALRLVGQDDNAAVRTNQVGYYAEQQKRCTFIYSCGDLFDVVNAETGAIAYSGAIVHRMEDNAVNETDYYGDFTNLRVPGTYFIRSQNGLVSHTFTIEADPYEDLRNKALLMLSYQRCGSELGEWAGQLSHAECHTSQATLFLTDVVKDVHGGWHDAGDFGRYVSTGAKAVNDLLLAYLSAPELFSDAIEGPDSGNGIPDILDEARYELEWMMRMQEEDGGLFCKVTSQSFPSDTTSPEADNLPLYLLASDTVSTADAAGSFAIAYLAFQEVDPGFAETCLACAEKAERYLHSKKNYVLTVNPMDFSTGQYLDDGDRDGRFTAYLALYAATGETRYLDEAKGIYEDEPSCVNFVSWNNNGMYGVYLFLTNAEAKDTDPEFYEAMEDALKASADHLVSASEGSGYENANAIYEWGSNAYTANDGIVLSMAYHVFGKQIYQQTAVEQINYLLGRNSLDLCFVSGFGNRSPKHQHNRLASAKGTSIPGALSGGPDASREDDVTEVMDWNTPPARMYADEYGSYSTNEIAIYYNSALLYLLASVS